MKIRLMALSLLLAAGSVQADFGFANSHCSKWLDPTLSEQAPQRNQWVLGYLTAAARYAGEDKNLAYLDPSDALRRLQGFCKANPEFSLEAAVMTEILKEE